VWERLLRTPSKPEWKNYRKRERNIRIVLGESGCAQPAPATLQLPARHRRAAQRLACGALQKACTRSRGKNPREELKRIRTQLQARGLMGNGEFVWKA
jgi:hypothetical protein